MTTAEKLQAIKARCEALLETASKRTPGEWEHSGANGIHKRMSSHYATCMATTDGENRQNNAAFIASCAGPAEAGWRYSLKQATNLLKYHDAIHSEGSRQNAAVEWAMDAKEIIAAWSYLFTE
jgi:hypothetical protein